MLVKKQVNNVGKTENFRYKDENDFVKKLHSLKTYCPRAYKDLIFNTNLQDLFKSCDGVHAKELFTDDLFKLVYGQIKLIYRVENGKVIIENLMPQEFLLNGYTYLLKTYKGMPFMDKRDKFKIDLSLAIFRRKELEI